MATTRKTKPKSAVCTEPTPVAIQTKRRKLTPSVTTPYLAAVVQDVTSPAPQVSVTPTVSPTGTASATATPSATQSPPTTFGAVPTVTTTTTAAAPVAAPTLVPVGSTALTASPPTPNVVYPPPSVVIPTPPAGYVAPNPLDYRGYHPSAREVSAASTAVANLATFADYGEVFGPLAPPASTVADALNLAVQWRNTRESTDTWNAYVHAEDGLAWKNALTLADKLKPVFLIAVSNNPSLATQYAGLAELFDAPKVAAKQATVTRKKNAKTRATTAASATPVAAAAPAPTAPEAAAPTPPKTVTVTV
jgi:type VI secretion system secreted protein VgrG